MYTGIYQPIIGWMLDVQDGVCLNEDDLRDKTYVYGHEAAYKLCYDLVRDNNGEPKILLGHEITRDKAILLFHNQSDIPIIIDEGVPKDIPLQTLYGYMKAATKNFDVDLFDKPHIYLCRLRTEELL